jgi:predicted kinase
MLIIVCGLPGSGKTTLAEALSRRVGAVHISSDAVRKEMFPRPVYSDEEKGKVYGELASRARRLLSEGRKVVVDATFYKKGQREAMRAIADEAKVQLRTILCSLPDETVRKRLMGRKPGGMSDADYAVYTKIKEVFDPMEDEHLELDSSLPMRELLKRALKYVGGG